MFNNWVDITLLMIGTSILDVYRDLIAVALGIEKADLLFENCQIVDVITGEIYEGCIAIKNDRIACMEKVRARKVVDLKNLYVTPGFIDGHSHPDYYLTLNEFSDIAVRHGTTAIFAEPDAVINSMGEEGFRMFVSWSKECSLRVYLQIPFISPHDLKVEHPNFELDYERLAEISQDMLVGLGEVVSWSGVISLDKDALRKVEFALDRNLTILGHSSGAKRNKLSAYSIVASSCHEAITPEQGIERLRNGMHLMVREGSIRSDIRVIQKLDSKVDKSWISLVSDGIEPLDLANGYMDAVARKAVEMGLDEIEALRMITVNPARYYGKEREIGIIAPGRYADLAILKDLGRFDVDRTIIGGKIPEPKRTSEKPFSIMRVERVEVEDLKIKHEGIAKIRVAELLSETVNREKIMEVEVKDGSVDGFCKAVLVDRFRNGNVILLPLDGINMQGAIATTVCFDQYNIVAIGIEDELVADAINRVIRMKGGICYLGEKEISLPLPYGGVMSRDVPQVMDKMGRLREVLKEEIPEFENPLNILHFMTFVSLPELKLSNKGIVKVKERKIVSLIVDQ